MTAQGLPAEYLHRCSSVVSYPVAIDIKCVHLAVTDLSWKPLLCLKSNYIPTGAPPACSLGYVIVIEAIRFPGLVAIDFAASGIMINIYCGLISRKRYKVYNSQN